MGVHDELVRRGAELADAVHGLEQRLGRYRAEASAVVADVTAGRVSVVDAIELAGGGSSHREMAEVIERFLSARRRFRVELTRLALSDGHTIAEVARGLGVSRQFVSRLAAEAKASPSS